MTITKATLRNRAMLYATILGAGETASSEDAAVVDEVIEADNEFLVSRGVSTWATSSIPDEVQGPWSRRIAALIAPMFGLGDQTAKAEYELGQIRSVTSVEDNSGEPTGSVYY